ncbi:hypothetical protein [Streptomyces sp. NBC_00212]|uniref:hypothetical protein n=1 Tax=Streptomyces sp. NBC_00212 TaxID=2975684 RepID=UPI00324CF0E4
MHRGLRHASAGLLALGVGLTLSCCDGLAGSGTARPIDRTVTVQGRTITTTTEVGGCQSARLTAHESGKSVSLTLKVKSTRKSGEACPDYIGLRPVSTTLRQPVGSRSLVDATTGSALNAR